MNYKGYIGKIEYDEENHIYFGEVVNARTVITFHGTSGEGIEDEFKASVDDYLQWCKVDGVEPD